MSNDVSLDINQKSNPVQTVAPPKEDNNMLRATDKITTLNCRLSVGDAKEKHRIRPGERVSLARKHRCLHP